jgi:gamma-glutamylcyclotransferase
MEVVTTDSEGSSSSSSSNNSGSFVYFAYGSSLAFDEFEAWCQQHSYTFPDLTRNSIARLHNYALTLNVSSKFWGGGVASITEFPGASVEGVAIELPLSQLDIVRHKEGAQTGLYVEIHVEIEVLNASTLSIEPTAAQQPTQRIRAVAYQASPSRIDSNVTPSVRYGNALVAGARARGLSRHWIDYLSSLIGATITSQSAVVSDERVRHILLNAIPAQFLVCRSRDLTHRVDSKSNKSSLIVHHCSSDRCSVLLGLVQLTYVASD